MLEEWKERLDKDLEFRTLEFYFAKLAAWNERENLRLIYSYLKGQKQGVKITNTYSDCDEIISGVPQGSTLWSILFDLLINDLFFFTEMASMHNFADDNTLSIWGETVSKLIDISESKSNIAID